MTDLHDLIACWFAAWRGANNPDLRDHWHVYERMLRDYETIIRRRIGR